MGYADVLSARRTHRPAYLVKKWKTLDLVTTSDRTDRFRLKRLLDCDTILDSVNKIDFVSTSRKGLQKYIKNVSLRTA